jgi:hypothetical protein
LVGTAAGCADASGVDDDASDSDVDEDDDEGADEDDDDDGADEDDDDEGADDDDAASLLTTLSIDDMMNERSIYITYADDKKQTKFIHWQCVLANAAQQRTQISDDTLCEMHRMTTRATRPIGSLPARSPRAHMCDAWLSQLLLLATNTRSYAPRVLTVTVLLPA